MRNFIRPSIIAGASYLFLGLLALFVLIPIGIDEPSNVKFRALAPSYWPQVICVMLALLGVGILVRALVLKQTGGDGDEFEPEAFEVFWRALLVIAGTFILYFSLETLGFVLATTITLLALMLLAGEYRLKILIPVSLGVPLALQLFFTKVASIPIPAGILEPLLLMI